MTHNTMSKREYLILHCMWGVFTLFWFYMLLFRNLHGLSYTRSRGVMVVLLVVFAVPGMCLNRKTRRNRFSVFVDLATPYGIYLAIAYRKTASVLIAVLLGAALLFSALYVFLLLRRSSGEHGSKGRVSRYRLSEAFFGVRAVAACCAGVLILTLTYSTMFSAGLFSPTVRAEERSARTSDSECHPEMLAVLEDFDAWDVLPVREKLNVLQTEANDQARELGLPHELNVRAGNLSEITLANYSDAEHMITIDLDHLENDSAPYVLDSLYHEARHAYQHRLCDLYESIDAEYRELQMFDDIRSINEEFANPVDGKADGDAYKRQVCETDAREYAYDRMIAFYFGEEQD